MFTKDGRYYADWYSPDGKRHRKTFNTALGAKRHETKQKALAPRAAQSAAAALRSRKPPVSALSLKSSVASRRRSISPISTRGMSNSPAKRGAKLDSATGTRTQTGSDASSRHSRLSELQTSVNAFQKSQGHNPGHSGRPKTKLVGVSRATTSDSDGLSLVPSTLDSDTQRQSA